MKIKEYVITSRTNPVITDAMKLQKKRFRDETGKFLVDGIKLSYEYISRCGAPALMFVDQMRSERILSELSELEKRIGLEFTVTTVESGVFKKLTEQSSPDGLIIVGEKNKLDFDEGELICEDERIILLDSLQDPGNVGTVIRTALAFGFDRVILSGDCADAFNPKTLRASMGAVFSLKLSCFDSALDAVNRLSYLGRRIYAAELRDNSVPLDSLIIRPNDVFIVGNEGHGISPQVSSRCFGSVYIPIDQRSESLNAAVAASVLMWHQRNCF